MDVLKKSKQAGGFKNPLHKLERRFKMETVTAQSQKTIKLMVTERIFRAEKNGSKITERGKMARSHTTS